MNQIDRPLKIAVGSKNPVKVNAALEGFRAMFPDQRFEAEGFAVESGVSDQPMSCDETLEGASNRVKALREEVDGFDYFVGIEGGIEIIDETMFANAWVVIHGEGSRVARGRSGTFALPPKVQRLVESGIELGYANDQVFEEHNSKHAGGAVGSLTGGVISRQSLYEHAMALTLVSFRQPDLYFEPSKPVSNS